MSPTVPLNRYIVFFAIALGGCALDLATKSWMFAHLGMPGPESRTWWLWDGVFAFQTNLNEGALFGMGQGFWPLFAVMAVLAAVGIFVWLFVFRAAKDWFLTVALGFISIGILGNLYDRLGLPGLRWNDAFANHLPGEPVHAVRDFILVMIGSWPWPTFNLADSALVLGAGLLIFQALFLSPDKPAENDQPKPQV